MILLSKIRPYVKGIERVSASIAILGSLHFGSHSIIDAENYLKGKYSESKQTVISYYAKTFHLVPEKQTSLEIVPLTSLTSLADSIALEHEINPAYFRSLVKSESRWNVNAIAYTKDRNVKAIGLGQVITSNFGKGNVCPEIESEKEAYDPVKNLRCSAKIFSSYLKIYNYDPVKAIRKYKASSSCINGGCPEVEEQVKEVLIEVGRSLPASLNS